MTRLGPDVRRETLQIMLCHFLLSCHCCYKLVLIKATKFTREALKTAVDLVTLSLLTFTHTLTRLKVTYLNSNKMVFSRPIHSLEK